MEGAGEVTGGTSLENAVSRPRKRGQAPSTAFWGAGDLGMVSDGVPLPNWDRPPTFGERHSPWWR